MLIHPFITAVGYVQKLVSLKEIGENKVKLGYLRMKQSMMIHLLVFVIFGFMTCLIYDDIIWYFFRFDEKIVDHAQLMMIYSLPAILLRMVNSTLRVFLEVNKMDENLGYSYLIQVFIFSQVSFFVINVLQMDYKSSGFILLTYEIYTLLSHIFFVQDIWEEDEEGSSQDLSMPASHRFKEYIQYCVKKLIQTFLWNFVIVLIFYMIGQNHSEDDMMTYCIYVLAGFVISYFSEIFSVYCENFLSKSMDNNSNAIFVENVEIFKRIYLGIAFIYAIIWLFVLWALDLVAGAFGNSRSKVKESMDIVKFLIMAKAFSSIQRTFHFVVSRILDNEAKTDFTYNFPHFFSILGCYIFSWNFGYGVLGVIGFEAAFSIAGFLMMEGFLDSDFVLIDVRAVKLRKEVENF